MSCYQSNYSINVPFVGDRTDQLSFETHSSITVTFVVGAGYVFNSISVTANPSGSTATPPTVSQTAQTITFYDPNGLAVDYNAEVDVSPTIEIDFEPTSKITFKPRTTCPG